jgi:TetR/AcrR family transcriptional regulator, regulator of cefoperazone and chloramphenicol sensitivity
VIHESKAYAFLKNKPDSQEQRSNATRKALLRAATTVFARDGFHAASLREISDIANVNSALIAYHFGNKEGIYTAIFAQIRWEFSKRLSKHLSQIELFLQDPSNAKDALEAIGLLTDTMLNILAHDDFSDWGQLIVREQHSPTAAFDEIYAGFMEKVLQVMLQIVLFLRSDLDPPDAKLVVITILGQVMVFRNSRAGVMRMMGWKKLSPNNLRRIRVQVRKNIEALLQVN